MADWMDEKGISFIDLCNFVKSKDLYKEDQINDLTETMKNLEID